MVNIREYSKNNYSSKVLDLKNENLEGKLIVHDLPNLEKIECDNNNFTSIELANLPKLNYFRANNCHLTDIKIENCPEINYFNASNNHLNNTGFLDSLNPEKLTILSIHSNDFSKQTLEVFSNFTGLEQLFIDNCDKAKFRKGIYNSFSGSLEYLQNLTKLEILGIGATDIESGLEYLPKSLRKIGLTSAIKVDTGCAKIRQELEEAANEKGVTEKLKSEKEKNLKGEEDPAWLDNYYRLAPWRQALELLGEDGLSKQNTQQWLDEHYSKKTTEEVKKRENIAFLTINDKNLKGHLDLKDFTKLEKLDCSDNQLTNLDLSQCTELTHLYCDNNSLTSLDFLKNLPHPEKLKEVYLGDNPELHSQNLEFLTPFTGLEELNIENCPFSRNLKTLKNLEKLKNIYISDTNIDSGLDDLPTSCQRVYCSNNKADRRSTIITKHLSKYSEEHFDNRSKKYYNLEEWKKNKQSYLISSVTPLERLFVIRSNFKQFLKKWNKEYEEQWYEKVFRELKAKIKKEKKGKITELSKLKSPEQFGRFKYLTGIEYASTSTTVIGGALTLLDFSTTGGVITLTAPLVGQGASLLKANFYEEKQKKWEEFEKDADTFLENFNELMGILKQIEVGEVGEVSEALEDLKKQVYNFLSAYDEDGNEEIDIKELTNGQVKFAKELNKVEAIVEAMKELEEQVINYRQDQVPIVNELLQKLTDVKEGKREKIEKIFKEKFPKREIERIIFSEQGENKEQYLIISSEVLNDSPKYYLNLINNFHKVNDLPQLFNVEGKVIMEEAEKLIKVEFTEEQEKRIENELKKLYQEKEVAEEKNRKKEKIIKEVTKKLLKPFQVEEKVEKNNELLSAKLVKWWTDFKTRMCTPIQCWDCLECCQEIKKDKGKVKEAISETISEQKGESSIQAQIEVPPKSNN